jgi:hypothetical protein
VREVGLLLTLTQTQTAFPVRILRVFPFSSNHACLQAGTAARRRHGKEPDKRSSCPPQQPSSYLPVFLFISESG